MTTQIRHQVDERAFSRRLLIIAASMGLLIGVAIIVRDVYPRVVTRIARRSLGCLTAKDYHGVLVQAGRRQLLGEIRTPASDVTRLLLWDDIHSIWRRNPLQCSWPEAMLAKGVYLSYEQDHSQANLDVVQTYCDKVIKALAITQSKSFVKTVDETMIGETMIALYERTGAVRYRIAAESLATYLVNRGKLEPTSLAYRDGNPVRLADGIGMTCPFLTRYAARFNCPEARRLAVGQLREFHRFGIERRSGLPFHGYNPARDFSPVGLVGWGRGVGWYAVGLIDTVSALPRQDPDREELEEDVRALAQSVVRYQRADGGWGSMLTCQSQFESSATAMIAYFLKRSINLGVISSDYDRNVARSLAALRGVTRANGDIDYAQGVLQDYNRHSTRYAPEAYAQGAALAVSAITEGPAP
jgi:unsaturated rhamnogalacturonyl hydrolase